MVEVKQRALDRNSLRGVAHGSANEEHGTEHKQLNELYTCGDKA